MDLRVLGNTSGADPAGQPASERQQGLWSEISEIESCDGFVIGLMSHGVDDESSRVNRLAQNNKDGKMKFKQTDGRPAIMVHK